MVRRYFLNGSHLYGTYSSIMFRKFNFKLKHEPKTILVGLLCCLFSVLLLIELNTIRTSSDMKWKILKDNARKRRYVPENLTDEITVVTAYWHLDTFKKGDSTNLYYYPDNYKDWLRAFRYINNPVIFYTDTDAFSTAMRTIRNETTHRTKVFKVAKNSSWAFLNLNKVKRILSIPGYPKHRPNTVIPEYPCSQHAKMDALSRAIKGNFYKTKYFTWLDVGYFRDRKENKFFQLEKPKQFNDSKIAMNEIYRKDKKLTPYVIFRENVVWVGGGLVLGKYDVLLRFVKKFKEAVDYFLHQNLTNSDQQIIYSTYSEEGMKSLKPTVEIQTYLGGLNWFYLGFSMVRDL